MVKFVYAKRSIPALFSMMLTFLLSFGISTTTNAQALACNHSIQLSLGSNCSDTLSNSLFVASMPGSGVVWLELKDANGTSIDSTSFVGMGHGPVVTGIGSYTVVAHYDADGGTDYGSDNSCWSNLNVEFKLDLGLDLGAVCGTGNDSCTFNCMYIDSIFMDSTWTGSLGLNPDFTGIASTVPCIAIDTTAINFRDAVVGDICSGLTIERTWYVPNPVAGSNSHSTSAANTLTITTQQFHIAPDSLSRVMAPHSRVEIACGTEKDPQSIYNYLISKTNPLTPDSAAMCAFPTLLSLSGSGSFLSAIDSLKLPLAPGVKSSDKTHISCNLATSYTDQSEIPICGKGVKWVRHWTVIDWCTQTDTSFTQIIDATSPGIITTDMKTDTFELSTDPWFCSANLQMDLPILKNLCSEEYWITLSNLSLGINSTFSSDMPNMTVNNLPPGNHQLIVGIQDDCNNNITDTIYVNVSDGVSPVAVAKEQVVATLLSAGGDCAAKVRANSIDNNSYDACSGDNVLLEVKRESDHDSLYNSFVELTSADLNDTDSRDIQFGIVKVLLRVWDDGDGNGTPGTAGDNFSIAWTNVRIEDKNIDVFAECGQTTIEVDCSANTGDIIDIHRPVATRAGCVNETVQVSHRIVANDRDDVCSTGGLTVEYYAGSKTLCRKTFWFMDAATVQIDSTIFPADIFDGSCTDAGFGDLNLDALDLSCSQIGNSVEEEVFEFSEGVSCLKILRHFSLIDWCEHDPNVETQYKYVDSIGLLVGYRSTDNGSTFNQRNGIWKRTQVVKISGSSEAEITGCTAQTFSAGNDCEAVVVLTNSADLATSGGICPAGNPRWEVSVDTNGDGTFDLEGSVVSTTTNDVEASFNRTFSVGTYNVRWSVSALCGARATCTSTFTVVDDKAPVPICIQTLSTAVMEPNMTIWASDFIASPAVDPCSATIEYSFSELTPDEKNKSITCADLPDGQSRILDVTIFAHDEGGNVGSCLARIQVDDTGDVCADVNTGNSLIAGKAYTEAGDDIESATIGITSSKLAWNASDETTVAGEYAFADVTMHKDYTLNSSKNDDILNGVSTLDLVLIQRHVLGLSSFDSPYKVIAADINNDEKVSAIDLVELRKLILGVYQTLPNNFSWRFVDAGHTFESATSPWPFTERIDISSLDHSMEDMDFIGVKIGDVNGNAIANSLITSGRSTNGTLVLNAADQSVVAGETFEMTLTAEAAIAGMQLDVDLNGAEFVAVASSALDLNASHYIADDHSLTLSWNATDAVAINGEVITITMRATRAGNVSEMVQFGNTFTSEAYNADLEVMDLAIEFDGAAEAVVAFELYQNEPNPFNQSTTISFLIGESGTATLSVFDVTGQMIYEVSDSYDKGLNQVTIGRSDLTASGVLYYQLNYAGSIATKKMISVQ